MYKFEHQYVIYGRDKTEQMKIKSLCEVEDRETFIEVAKVIKKLDKNSMKYLIELILRVYAFLISASQLEPDRRDNSLSVAPE